MNNMKLGVVIIGRKRPGFDQEWNRLILQRSLKALEDLGMSCIGANATVVDDATIEARLAQMKAAGCEALLVLQPSLGHGQLALTLNQLWEGPVALWATPERPEGEKVSSCSLVAQHLFASALRQANHPFELVYGDPGSEDLREELRQAIAICAAAAKLRTAKVGLVGTHAPGFVDLASDPFLIRRRLGAQLHSLSLPQFIERVRAAPESEVKADVEKTRSLGLPMVGLKLDDLAANSRYYLAMREVMREESLDALAIQCWPELPNIVGQWPYLAVSRLCNESEVVAIEGDADGAITCLMAKLIGAGIGFLTDWLAHDQKTITFWHPGMAPLQMLNAIGRSADGPSLAMHFNIAKPLVVDGPLKVDQPVTVARLWRCDGQYHLTAFEGRTIPMARKLCGNTALMETDRDVPQLFDQLIHAGLPHHVVLFYGHHRDRFRRLARLLNLHWL
jgi:L-fucose isomerase-like protein